MSLPGRPKGEYRSAKHVGCLMSLPGRPKGEYRSAKHVACLMSAAHCAQGPCSFAPGAAKAAGQITFHLPFCTCLIFIRSSP